MASLAAFKVLTALCDTVLTTNAQFAVTLSNESADKLFKRPWVTHFAGMFFNTFQILEKDLYNRTIAQAKVSVPNCKSFGLFVMRIYF